MVLQNRSVLESAGHSNRRDNEKTTSHGFLWRCLSSLPLSFSRRRRRRASRASGAAVASVMAAPSVVEAVNVKAALNAAATHEVEPSGEARLNKHRWRSRWSSRTYTWSPMAAGIQRSALRIRE